MKLRLKLLICVRPLAKRNDVYLNAQSWENLGKSESSSCWVLAPSDSFWVRPRTRTRPIDDLCAIVNSCRRWLKGKKCGQRSSRQDGKGSQVLDEQKRIAL